MLSGKAELRRQGLKGDPTIVQWCMTAAFYEHGRVAPSLPEFNAYVRQLHGLDLPGTGTVYS